MNNDFIYDTERFKNVASNDTLQQGLAYFTEHRVLALDKQDRVLTALIQDADADTGYDVELTKEVNGKLNVHCACNTAKNSPCKHAVAALYSYAAQHERYKNLIDNAASALIQECVNKGENEIRTKLISGNVGLGVWQATSITPTTNDTESSQVHIRSLNKRLNYCTCTDFNRYRLATCKHIEAVLFCAQKKPDYHSFLTAGIAVSFVYMAWENNKPVMRLHALSTMGNDLVAICANFFGSNKVFSGYLPTDFPRFTEQVSGREDLHIGEDAIQYAQKCVKDATEKLRTEKISADIMRTNGAIPGLKARLLPYQIEGTAFLAAQGRAILADDTGLGKTLQSIAAASWLLNHTEVKRVLIVCPASLMYQWSREIKKFATYSVEVIQGSAEQRTRQYQSDTQFCIVNYELAIRDLKPISDSLNPGLLIVDEPQRTKNWRTRVVPKLKLIPAQHVFVLSGLALEKRLDDLYSLLLMVDACLLDPLWRYLLDYQMTDATGKVIGYRNLADLQQRVAPVLLRRQHSQISSQLLEKTEVRIDVPLDKRQRELHDAALSNAKQLAQIGARRTLTPGEQHRLLAALQQARMACNAAGMIDNETQGSPKLHELSHLLEELCVQNQHKAVIFSQWTLMTEMVEALTQQLGLTCVRLHGGLGNDERIALINSFKNNDAVQVLISTDAGSIGLNLKVATVLINMDMPWNPAILGQRIARIHKSGQKNNVQVFLMLAEDSYEQRVTKLVKSKRDLFDNVISPEASDDVVGVSKKMLQILIDSLNSDTANHDRQLNGQSSQATAPIAFTATETDDDRRLRLLLERIQTVFKHRIQQVLGSAKELLIIVDPTLNSDEDVAHQLSIDNIPIAVLDSKTLNSLKRLGIFATLANMPILHERPIESTVNPLTQLANAKLHSAEILLAQKCTAGIMDLLASAMLLQAAAITGQFQAPAIDSVTIWLHNEILPQQLLTQDQATAIIRVISLQQSQDVPFKLIKQAVADAGLFCRCETDAD
jgi:superfamily II DNA or RNA helicase